MSKSLILITNGFSGEESFGPLPILAIARKFEINEAIFSQKKSTRFFTQNYTYNRFVTFTQENVFVSSHKKSIRYFLHIKKIDSLFSNGKP